MPASKASPHNGTVVFSKESQQMQRIEKNGATSALSALKGSGGTRMPLYQRLQQTP
jgi:hypothetical protein